MATNRNLTLDIAKAICIILMVVGHSWCPDYLYRFVYMFHMPCFFFISGWLLSDKYLVNVKCGLKRKAKGIYWPFVKWQLLFLAGHNLFAAVHIYDNAYTLSQFFEKVVRIFTMTGGEQLLGGYWFLISLFWSSIFSLLFLAIIHKIQKLTPLSIMGGVILTLLIAMFEGLIPFKLSAQFGQQTFIGTVFYMSGYFYKKQQVQICKSNAIGICLLFIPAVAAICLRWGMIEVNGMTILPYYLIALAGTIGVISLSKFLAEHQFANVLVYIGNKTLYILTFHFLAFKLVSFLYIKHCELPIELLSQFPVIKESPDWLWLIYSIVGVVFSLFIWEAFHQVPLLLKTCKEK